ncbi:hypothetical protein CEUSTIGMA_g8292.t1 [Chlamydomonas eustigma]|uniref:SAM domain-containing protein n=1 Tax=Chlamydomonas eustigma TaxID=1157962 RepID=A0A250XCN9_9CHLO|nr:hypothetical protein CEUSTIGMA_g8292.t1 [Chlamydomonas eustigma]|eukprot:GAX80857.1 hypothetical protein CEUSTIGMA_g8292.t1 [Chlamydomonas eustigma]
MPSDDDDFSAPIQHKKRKSLAVRDFNYKSTHAKRATTPSALSHTQSHNHIPLQRPALATFFLPKNTSTHTQDLERRELSISTENKGHELNYPQSVPNNPNTNSGITATVMTSMTPSYSSVLSTYALLAEERLKKEPGVTGHVHEKNRAVISGTDTSDSDSEQVSDLAVSEAGDDACEIIDLVSEDEELKECEEGVRDLTIALVPGIAVFTTGAQTTRKDCMVEVKQEQTLLPSPGPGIMDHIKELPQSRGNAQIEITTCPFNAPPQRVQSSSPEPNFQHTVYDWLNSIGMSCHAPLFEAAEVDLDVLPHLLESDLKELGVTSAMDRLILMRSIRATERNSDGVMQRCRSPPLGQPRPQITTVSKQSPQSASRQKTKQYKKASPSFEQRLAIEQGEVDDGHQLTAVTAVTAVAYMEAADRSGRSVAATPSIPYSASSPSFSHLYNVHPPNLSRSRITSYFQPQHGLTSPTREALSERKSSVQGSSSATGSRPLHMHLDSNNEGMNVRALGTSADGSGSYSNVGHSRAVDSCHKYEIGATTKFQGLACNSSSGCTALQPPQQPKLRPLGVRPVQKGAERKGQSSVYTSGTRGSPLVMNELNVSASAEDGGAMAVTESGVVDCSAALLAEAAAAGPPQGTALSRKVQRWHTIPGTRFLVDLFRQDSRDIRGCKYWFLTHFHSDHYMGLTRKFDQGIVVCGSVTAQLVNLKLRVPWTRIMVLPLDIPVLIEGTTITLVEANHCPGATMIIAEPPSGVPVLHTGDARDTVVCCTIYGVGKIPVLQTMMYHLWSWQDPCATDYDVPSMELAKSLLSVEMQEHPILKGLVGRSILILDTTYCNPLYTFPPQKEVLQFTLDAVQSENFNPRVLYLFGTYTIGKERLFMEVARTLGKQVYVSKEKLQILKCCNLTPEYANMLTTNHLDTNIHAVPLFKINIKAMSEILSGYQGRYNAVVGFSPTGWSHQKEQKKGARLGKKVQKGSLIMYQVPYSEHSSFEELVGFVKWFRPVEVLPSVNTDNGGPKQRKLLQLLQSPPQEEHRKQPTIQAMFSKQNRVEGSLSACVGGVPLVPC